MRTSKVGVTPHQISTSGKVVEHWLVDVADDVFCNIFVVERVCTKEDWCDMYGYYATSSPNPFGAPSPLEKDMPPVYRFEIVFNDGEHHWSAVSYKTPLIALKGARNRLEEVKALHPSIGMEKISDALQAR